MFCMISYNVMNSAKFSYSIAKGSVETRLAKAQELNNQIYSKIKDNLISTQKNYIMLSDLKEIILSVFPEKKKFALDKISKKDEKNMAASADYLFDQYENITGHIVEIPARKNRFAMIEIPTLMHELTHVFDKMFNPKIMKRSANLSYRFDSQTKNSFSFDKYNRLYDKFYGSDYEQFSNEAEKVNILNLRKQELLKLLRGRSAEEKIDVIQNIRYHLGLELNAYTVENGYIDRMTPKGADLSELKTDVDKYLFKEKIQMLKELAFDIIRKEREKLARKCNNIQA